jgi:hypothetical protein
VVRLVGAVGDGNVAGPMSGTARTAQPRSSRGRIDPDGAGVPYQDLVAPHQSLVHLIGYLFGQLSRHDQIQFPRKIKFGAFTRHMREI